MSTNKIIFDFSNAIGVTKLYPIASNSREIINDCINSNSIINGFVETTYKNIDCKLNVLAYNEEKIGKNITSSEFEQIVIKDAEESTGMHGLTIEEAVIKIGEYHYNINKNYIKEFIGIFTKEVVTKIIAIIRILYLGKTYGGTIINLGDAMVNGEINHSIYFSEHVFNVINKVGYTEEYELLMKLFLDDEFVKEKHIEFIDGLSDTELDEFIEYYQDTYLHGEYTGEPNAFKEAIKFGMVDFMIVGLLEQIEYIPIILKHCNGEEDFATFTITGVIDDALCPTEFRLFGNSNETSYSCTFEEYVNNCQQLNNMSDSEHFFPLVVIRDGDDLVYDPTFTKHLDNVVKSDKIRENGTYAFVNN